MFQSYQKSNNFFPDFLIPPSRYCLVAWHIKENTANALKEAKNGQNSKSDTSIYTNFLQGIQQDGLFHP